jgi:uncharacterized protein
MKGLSKYLQQGFASLSDAQRKFLVPFLITIILITALLGVGWFKITFESDFSKMDPTHPPITKLSNKITKDFQYMNNVVVAIQLDDSVESKYVPQDIRDPKVIEFLVRLDKNLKEEVSILEVRSLGSVFFEGIPPNLEGVKNVLGNVPAVNGLISSDYSFTIAVVEADLGGDSKKIKEFSDRVSKIVEESSPPAGIKTITTGEAPLGAIIFNLIISDAIKTGTLAVIFIFVLLLFIRRSLRDSVIVTISLLVGISWTFSLLGWLDLPINIGTAGISAMLIGLGVEYNIFLVSRYREENLLGNSAIALKNALSNIGTSILSSGGTTAIGFLALATSMFPVLGGLGKTLAIGIIMLLGSTILVTPLLLIVEDKIPKLQSSLKPVEKKSKIKKKKSLTAGVYESYGGFVSRNPGKLFLIAIIITVFMFYMAGNLNNQDMDFENMLPEGLEEMEAFKKIQNEFGDTRGISIYVGLDPSSPITTEPKDVRDPVVLRYIDVLTQKSRYISDVVNVRSISKIARNNNDGMLLQTVSSQKDIYDGYLNNLISKDYSIALVKVDVDGTTSSEEIVRQLQEIVINTDRPVGIDVQVIGGMASQVELNGLFGSDSNRTSMLALFGILLFLFILSFSIRSTLLPIVTVIFGVLWTIGLIGLFRIPFNNITSSVITMTIGIGIDFGIQLMSRYDYELITYDKREAMKKTLTNVLPPMVITVIAAVVGFRAMVFGELNLMADLGVTMSVAMVACMFAAITGVAGMLVLFKREKKVKV